MEPWTVYNNYVRETHHDIERDIDNSESITIIIDAIIKQRHTLNLSQMQLAELCGMSRSSIAKIESGNYLPSLTTLLNILEHLGLRLTVQTFDINQM